MVLISRFSFNDLMKILINFIYCNYYWKTNGQYFDYYIINFIMGSNENEINFFI